MKLFLAILCLVLAFICSVPSFAQCSGSSSRLPGKVAAAKPIRTAAAKLAGLKRILPRNR